MAGIQSTGIGSGLDITSIVTQLVQAEGAPVDSRLNRREADVQSKLSAFGSLKSALNELKSAAEAIAETDGILSRKAVFSEDGAFDVTVDSTASPADYDIEVVNLATAQKLTSGVFASDSAAVGYGSLTIDYGDESFTLDIAAASNSLADIRDAINSAADNPGVSASIVNADDGSYLILSGNRTGSSNTISITQSGGDGGLASLEYDSDTGTGALTEGQPADDARIRIDTLLVQSDTNTFDDAIDGVSIDLRFSTGGETQSLSVANDVDDTANKITRFTRAYNELVDLNGSLTAFDQESGAAGALLGDSTLRSVVSQIRTEITTAVTGLNGPYSLLGDIGIELQVDGKFDTDLPALKDKLAADFNQIGQLFTSENGFATRVGALAESFLGSDGILETRTEGLNSQVERIAEQRERLETRLASLEERLFRQYNALDSLLSELNNTSTFLAGQLNNLPGFTRPSNN